MPRVFVITAEHPPRPTAHPVGSPEAWAAILTVRRALYGEGVSTDPVRRTPEPPPEMPPPRACASCGAPLPVDRYSVRCKPCDTNRIRMQRRRAREARA